MSNYKITIAEKNVEGLYPKSMPVIGKISKVGVDKFILAETIEDIGADDIFIKVARAFRDDALVSSEFEIGDRSFFAMRIPE